AKNAAMAIPVGGQIGVALGCTDARRRLSFAATIYAAHIAMPVRRFLGTLGFVMTCTKAWPWGEAKAVDLTTPRISAFRCLLLPCKVLVQHWSIRASPYTPWRVPLPVPCEGKLQPTT